MCLVKCKWNVVTDFVECLVWWLMWVAFVVHVGSVVLCLVVLVNVGFVERSAFR